ncbi:hypothetical protein ACIPJN_29930 [Streptomyces sp. NPDC086796]|uniref:hypothetical protein n=1 Tax=Streptomyces sp. NPDC086796 TaxID=3365760 RepID=UPI0037FAF1D7
MDDPTSSTAVDFRARAEAERHAVHAQFDQLGREMAGVLNEDLVEGGGWSHTVSGLYAGGLVLHHQGRDLGIQVWRDKSYLKGAAGRRLKVEGRYSSEYHGWRADSITVSMDRPAPAIARDIVRRFLPGYLATVDASIQAARKAEEERRARRRLNRRLADMIPGLRARGGYDPAQEPDRTRSYWSSPVYDETSTALVGGHIALASDGQTANIALDAVPQELALRILALVHPRQVLEGTIAPRPIPPARRALSTSRVIRGEVVGEQRSPTGTADRWGLVDRSSYDLAAREVSQRPGSGSWSSCKGGTRMSESGNAEP